MKFPGRLTTLRHHHRNRATVRRHADYHLERITPVLNQPTYVTQAPGDPAEHSLLHDPHQLRHFRF